MKILVVGGGSIGKRHLRNLNLLGYDELYCFKRKYDSKFEINFNCKVICSDKELKNLCPSIIVICNPSSEHLNWIKKAQVLNASLFVEKPMVISQSQLTESINIWKNNNVFFIGFMLRYHPAVKKIKSILEKKLIGDIYSARFEFGSWLPYWHPWEDYKKSYASQKLFGGGVINTICHELDLIQFFFDLPKNVISSKKNYGILEIDVEEICECILEYPDKLVSLHLDYLQKDYDRNIKILGSKGKIVWDWHSEEVKVFLHKRPLESYKFSDFDLNQLYIDEMKDFLNLVSQKKLKHSLDFDYAVSNTKLILKMHK